MTSQSDKLRELSALLAENPESVYDMSPEDMIEVSKHLNPIGNVITNSKKYANMSIINWTEEYNRKLIITSFIGYLYQLQAEYVPDEEIELANRDLAETLEYIKNNVEDATLRDKLIQRAKNDHANKVKLLNSTAQGIVKRFLDRHMEFNPLHHVRKATSENKADPERKSRDEEIKRIVMNKPTKIESNLAAKSDVAYTYIRDMFLQTQATLNATMAAVKPMLPASKALDADMHGILVKKYAILSKIADDVSKVATPLAEHDTLTAWLRQPPVELYHQFNRYFTNHYEQLRNVTRAVYNEKPDVEYAVIFYDCHKTPEAARDYRVSHEAQFRAEVLTIENSGVTLLGPFKENRERVDFYNKNTEVLKRMMEQLESDHKLGKDLMEKKVKAEKTKNVREMGPDAPGLAAYAKANNIVQELGARKVLTQEDQETLAKATAIKEDFEVPDEAIQVDMFYPKTDAEGNTILSKTKFYTQAEAPLHMQDNSEYNEMYQPKRTNKMLDSYKTKIITDRNGKKQEIRVPK